jgi:hydroxymethylglutaryl-CoA synthase
MSGLISYGAYVPYYRMNQSLIRDAWGRGAGKGERSVANFDEDSITMAASAGMDCIRGFPLEEIDGLYFCSTTSPYNEKQCATHLVWVLGMRPDVVTADFTNSLRAGTTALKAAHDAIEAGSARKILVVAADCRLGVPSSEQEMTFGDGAAAFLVGRENEIATFQGFFSLADQIQDVWRNSKDDFVLSGEGRWVIKEGYIRSTAEAIRGLLSQKDIAPGEIGKAALSAPNSKALTRLTREVGFDMDKQVQDPLLSKVGNTGCAHSLMLLVSALEAASEGERLLVTSYGDGCDAMLFHVTMAIERSRDRRGIAFYLDLKQPLNNYEKYLSFRQLVDRGTQASFRGLSSLTMMWRDRKWVYGLFASKCRQCGMTIFPPQRICYGCRAKDDFDYVRLSDKKAHVYTYSLDMLAGGMDPPIVQVVLEFEDGTRIYCAMTDRDPEEVEIGMPVEMTFRKLHEGAGFNNYFWKCRPLKGDS